MTAGSLTTLGAFLFLGARWLDVLAIGGFFAFVAWMGLRGANRNTTTGQYFLGGRNLPGWAIGLSLVGTSLSSITFLSLPAAAFAADYRTIVPNLTLPLVAVLAAIFLIPLYRRVAGVSAFEYLEQRFGPGVRLYAAGTFLLMQAVRVCVVLYMASLPLAYLTGLPIIPVIVACGLFLGVYTVYGGLEAVIWTDVLQTFVLLAGGLICLGIILYAVPGGLGEVIAVGREDGKFGLGGRDSLSFSLGEKTLWVMIVLGLVNFGSAYVGDQAIVQRYLAARSLKEARHAAILCAAVSVPVWLMFFFLGTCLFVFYDVFPDPVVAAFRSPDEVVPYFISHSIPPGLLGLIIAGCIAAAMSTLDSSINAMSTVLTTDFYQRVFRPEADDAGLLRFAKLASAGVALGMILGAVALHFTPRESMVNLGFIATQILGGAILAVFLVGFLLPRIGNRAMLVGIAAVLAVNLYFAADTLGLLPATVASGLHTFWVRAFLNVVLVVAVLAASLLLPRRAEPAAVVPPPSP